ncbi:MAG: aromatic amino acid transaminase [Janthinobacterium lividum]
MFNHVEAYPGDPILTLMEQFLADPRPHKVNLGIGLYYGEDGRIPVLPSVRAAQEIHAARELPHTYLSMEGLAAYREGAQKLVFGAGSDAVRSGRIATMQSIGGSGALHIAGRFIRQYLPQSKVYISDPTWDNHRALIESAGVTVLTYPYYDPATNGLKFDAMRDAIDGLDAGSIILLQPSCHNPTGVDLDRAQWQELIGVMQKRKLLPFIDMAYQGFGAGMEDDAWPIRTMVDAGMTLFVSNSFSKNFSLYGERVGALSIVCANAEEAGRVLGQLKSLVRSGYSSPPSFGAQIVAVALQDERIKAMWQAEVQQMRERIQEMRITLRAELEQLVPGVSASYLTAQHGMFSYTGLPAAQVDALRNDHGIYLVRSGRVCLAGLNHKTVGLVGEAFADVVARDPS